MLNAIANQKLSLCISVATLLLAPGCDSGDGGTGDTDAATSGTSGGSTTTTATTATSGGPSTSPTDTSAGTTTESPTSGTTDSTAGSSSTTGSQLECVSTDLGSAVGPMVFEGSNEGEGDDFSLEFCDREFGGETTGGTTGGALTGGELVIAWTAPETLPYIISTEGSELDTVLSVVAASCDGVGDDCNDDCFGVLSGLVYDATAGETVFIVVEGYDGGVGNVVLNIEEGGGGFECDTSGGSTSTGGI